MFDVSFRQLNVDIINTFKRYRVARLFFMAYVKGYSVDRINSIYLYYANKDFKLRDITKSIYFYWLTKDGLLDIDKVWGFMLSKHILGKRFASRDDSLRCYRQVLINFDHYEKLLKATHEHFSEFKKKCSSDLLKYKENIYE